MPRNILKQNPENRILDSAKKLFILNGFYGTTIYQIAKDAEVSKTSIHYYYRSKMKLYESVFPGIIQDFKNIELGKKYRLQILIFLLSELSTNEESLLRLLKRKNQIDWFKGLYEDVLNKFI